MNICIILVFIEFSVMCPYVKTRFKIAPTVYTFELLLEQEDVLYHIHNIFALIFVLKIQIFSLED